MGRTLLLAALLAAPFAHADDWPAAKRVEIFRSDGVRFVRIIPGESLGDVLGFAGAAKGRYARAEHYVQEDGGFALAASFDLENPIAPVDALLSNSGRLITFDNWHNAGYGKVVAIYSPKGELIRAYELEELFSDEDLAAIPRSVSSRWWRAKPQGWSDPGAESIVYLHECRGGYFTFDLATGEQRYQKPGKK